MRIVGMAGPRLDTRRGTRPTYRPTSEFQNVYRTPSCIVRGRSAMIDCMKNADDRSPTGLPKFTLSNAL